MRQEYFNLMSDFIHQAGEIAKNFVSETEFSLKADGSVLTHADQKVARLIHTKLDPFLQTREHILIEEEDPQRGVYLNQELLNAAPFIWSVDPIDGTRLFSNQMPLFGISIGLIKDLKPWLGMVYFPLLDELFYADGENSYYVRHPFTSAAVKKEIQPIDQEISSQSLFLMSDTFFKKYKWNYENCRLLVTACATVNLCWPCIGRGCGAMDQSHLWDFAGAWPIIQKAGLGLRHLKTGALMDTLDADCFKSDEHCWQLKEYYIASSAKNFDILVNKIS